MKYCLDLACLVYNNINMIADPKYPSGDDNKGGNAGGGGGNGGGDDDDDDDKCSHSHKKHCDPCKGVGE